MKYTIIATAILVNTAAAVVAQTRDSLPIDGSLINNQLIAEPVQTNTNAEGVSIAPSVVPPHQSAMLDVQASSKGVLIPRMSQAARNNIQDPAESLLIYQTDNEPGYYFYQNGTWQPLGGNGDSFWEEEFNFFGGPLDLPNFPNLIRRLIYRPEVGSFSISSNSAASTFHAIYTSQRAPSAAIFSQIVNDRAGLQLITDTRRITDSGFVRGLPFAQIRSNNYPLEIRSDRNITIRAFSNDDPPFFTSALIKLIVTLKTNIKTLPRALNKIMRIRGVSYNWTDTNQVQTTQIGVIAQEVEKVYPELVTTVETEDPSTNGKKAVNYTGLIAPLLEAVKAQN